MTHLTDAQVLAVISDYDAEIPNKIISKTRKISGSTVNRILAGKFRDGFKSVNYPRKRGWTMKAAYHQYRENKYEKY